MWVVTDWLCLRKLFPNLRLFFMAFLLCLVFELPDNPLLHTLAFELHPHHQQRDRYISSLERT